MTGFYGADASCGNGAASINHCGMDESHGPNGSLSPNEAEAELAAARDKLSDETKLQGGDQETKALLKDIKEMLSELLQKKEGQDGTPGAEDPDGGCGDDMKHGGCGDEPMECGGSKPDEHADDVSGHDDLDGGHGDDEMRGGKGHDQMHGGKGDDEMRGGMGHDTIRGGEGDDRMYGRERS